MSDFARGREMYGATPKVQRERDEVRALLLEARNALHVAASALGGCYQVVDWPADGTTDQDFAMRDCELLAKRLDAFLGLPAKPTGE